MILHVQFNDEPVQLLDLRELHVQFDDNMLQLVVNGEQLVNIWRPLSEVQFPEQTLTLTVSNVETP
jgi:hypothetical protein